MEAASRGKTSELTALLIAPDRDLAGKFTATVPETRAFQILADHRTYPPQQTLDIRLRQLKPDVVLLDLATDLDTACELIRMTRSIDPQIQVIGLHHSNDSKAVVQSLRAGAAEFLSAPFNIEVQREAIARVLRLRVPDIPVEPEFGKVAIFSSTKPGSGATTLATQCAFAIRRITGKRVLLLDLDLLGGTIGFSLKLNHQYSMMDVLQRLDRLDATIWGALTTNLCGVDILPSPELPVHESLESSRLHDILEYARLLYDWVVVDLPCIFQRVSLLAMSETDRAYLVTTAELPSLHLTHKAITLLDQLGVGKERFEVVVNRMNKKDGLGGTDIQKIFNCSIHAQFPNDYFSLHRAVTLGQPLEGDGELGKAIESLVGKLTGSPAAERRRSDNLLTPRPALSQTLG